MDGTPTANDAVETLEWARKAANDGRMLDAYETVANALGRFVETLGDWDLINECVNENLNPRDDDVAYIAILCKAVEQAANALRPFALMNVSNECRRDAKLCADVTAGQILDARRAIAPLLIPRNLRDNPEDWAEDS